MIRQSLNFAALISAYLPAIAFAQDTAPERAMEGAVEEAVESEVHQNHSGGGLPQFNPETWPSQVFWLAISFLLLYLVFAKIVLPSLGRTIIARADKIEGDLRTAENLSSQAEAMRHEYEAGLKAASASSAASLKQIEDDAKTRLAHSLSELKTRADADVVAAEGRIQSSKAVIMRDMGIVAVDIAISAAKKIADMDVDAESAQSVVNSIQNKAA